MSAHPRVIRKSVTITAEQADFVEAYTINLSRLLQRAIEARMREAGVDPQMGVRGVKPR